MIKDIFRTYLQCFEKLHELYNDFPFLPQRMKIDINASP